MVDPLVSCVMPTFNRGKFLSAAVECFLKQTYENKELIILDDSTEPLGLQLDSAWPVQYIYDKHRILGTKRNAINALARGEIICHWDDDDWSAADRIAAQVAEIKRSGMHVTGFGTLLFWDVNTGQAKQFRSSIKGYVCGTSLCYLKSFWQKHPFPDIQKASDNGFVYPILKQIASSHDASHMVARIHSDHTSSKAGIQEIVPNSMIPAAFWDNEKLRINGHA